MHTQHYTHLGHVFNSHTWGPLNMCGPSLHAHSTIPNLDTFTIHVHDAIPDGELITIYTHGFYVLCKLDIKPNMDAIMIHVHSANLIGYSL